MCLRNSMKFPLNSGYMIVLEYSDCCGDIPWHARSRTSVSLDELAHRFQGSVLQRDLAIGSGEVTFGLVSAIMPRSAQLPSSCMYYCYLTPGIPRSVKSVQNIVYYGVVWVWVTSSNVGRFPCLVGLTALTGVGCLAAAHLTSYGGLCFVRALCGWGVGGSLPLMYAGGPSEAGSLWISGQAAGV